MSFRKELLMSYLSLKAANIEKISPLSTGKIHYRILTDQERNQLFVVFTGNDDGGHYSAEVVPFERIELCVKDMKPGAYVASKQFFKAFDSRSNNNCGFLAAILRAEELLAPVVDGVRKHVLQPGWDVWQELMLEETGLPWEPPLLTPLPKGSVAVAAEPKPKLNRKKAVVVNEPTDAPVVEPEPVDAEEVSDAESN
jgi:hypothetical protein